MLPALLRAAAGCQHRQHVGSFLSALQELQRQAASLHSLSQLQSATPSAPSLGQPSVPTSACPVRHVHTRVKRFFPFKHNKFPFKNQKVPLKPPFLLADYFRDRTEVSKKYIEPATEPYEPILRDLLHWSSLPFQDMYVGLSNATKHEHLDNSLIKLLFATAETPDQFHACLNLMARNYLALGLSGQHHDCHSDMHATLLQEARRLSATEPLVKLWESIYEYGLKPDVRLLREAIDVCATAKDAVSAEKLYQLARLYFVTPDGAMCGKVLDLCDELGLTDKAAGLKADMDQLGVQFA